MKAIIHTSLVSIAVSALVCISPAQHAGEWTLNESSGTNAADLSGNNNFGTLTNFGANPWVAGKFGNALLFDGVDDYVAISIAQDLPVYKGTGEPFSIAYWVKAPAHSNGMAYTESQAGSSSIFVLASGQSSADTSKFRVYLRNDAGMEPLVGVSTSVVYDNSWHHVAFVHNSFEVTLYVDGVKDATNFAYKPNMGPGEPGNGTFSTGTSSMGAIVRGGSCCFMQGMLDDLRVYKFAMTAADVKLAMQGSALLPASSSLGDYGVGCGTGPFDLVRGGSASIGSTVQLSMQSGPPGSPAVLLFGFGAVAPVDLTPLGFSGCTTYPANYLSVATGVLGPTGAASVLPIPVPNNPALLGGQVNFQAGVIDVATFNLEFSDAVIATVGN